MQAESVKASETPAVEAPPPEEPVPASAAKGPDAVKVRAYATGADIQQIVRRLSSKHGLDGHDSANLADYVHI